MIISPDTPRNLWEKASLVLGGGWMAKANKLQALKPLSSAGEFTALRGTGKYVKNEAGVLTLIGPNDPPLEYDAVVGKWGIRPEGAVTNLLLRSEEFGDAAWTKTDLVVNANSANSPDGTNTSDKIVANAGVRGTLVQFVSVPDSTTFAVSIYAKPGEIESLALGFVQKNGAEPGAVFDLNTNAITNYLSVPINAHIEETSNGFKRCVIIFNSNSGGTSPRVRIYAPNLIGVGDGVSGYFIWGAQLETGSVATSYIKTDGAIQSRNADAIYKVSATAEIGQTEGTLYVDTHLLTNNAINFRSILGISDDTVNNRISIRKTTDNKIQASIVVGGSVVALIETPSNQFGRFKIAVAYAANSFVMYVNGTQYTGTTSPTIPACSRFDLGKLEGSTSNSNYLNDMIFDMVIDKNRLSNDKLALATTL